MAQEKVGQGFDIDLIEILLVLRALPYNHSSIFKRAKGFGFIYPSTFLLFRVHISGLLN